MNKGKGLFGMTSRPRRRSSRVFENYDDNHLWEDGAVYAGERLRIHATKWQDLVVLDHWGIKEDFNAFAAAAGLLKFSVVSRCTDTGSIGYPLLGSARGAKEAENRLLGRSLDQALLSTIKACNQRDARSYPGSGRLEAKSPTPACLD